MTTIADLVLKALVKDWKNKNEIQRPRLHTCFGSVTHKELKLLNQHDSF